MTLIKPTENWQQLPDQAAQRRHGSFGNAARAELALRNAMEGFLRERRPNARLCHEMVMGGGSVRADVVALDLDHIVAVEVKGHFDGTKRLLYQVGLFQLCVPEVWIVVAERHCDDAELVRWLIPSVGLIRGTNMGDWRNAYDPEKDVTLDVIAEPVPRDPVPRQTLEMLWRDELAGACHDHGIAVTRRSTRPTMISSLLDQLEPGQVLAAACKQLRSRDALWRADKPVGAA